MTLRRQLFLVLSALFLVVLSAILLASLSGTRRYLEQQLASHAQDAATALSIPLAQALGKGDSVLAETQVNSIFDRGYFKQVQVLGAGRAVVINKLLPEKIDQVPAWFVEFFPIDTPAGEAHLTSGWRQLGKVIVTSQPTFAYQYLWTTALNMAEWITGIFVAALLLMQMLLRFILQPLQMIERSARAVQEKRFEQIARIPSAPELGSVVVAMNDMSRRVAEMLDAETARAEALRKEAYDDESTGLANRRGFEVRLMELLNGDMLFASAAVISFDIGDIRIFSRSNGFDTTRKLIDSLLAATKELLAPLNLVLSGHINEFTFSFIVADPPQGTVERVAPQLRDRLFSEISHSPASGLVTLSLGVAWFHPGYSRSEVFSRSDLAVESARQSGRNAVVILPDTREESGALGSFAWRMLIENALKENRWLLVGQPVIRLQERTVLLHGELMVRLVDHKSNLVPASNFLPMAARHHLLPEVDRAVVTLGLDYLRRGEKTSHVAINLSFQGVADSGFMEWLGKELSGLKRDAKRLSIEMSEFACLRNVDAAQGAMALVRKQGGQFGIDNFGLDPASLKLLRQMPPDYIKLSGNLIADIATDEHARNVVVSITQLAHSLEVKVIAQNVEQEEQVVVLLDAGVDGGQGYLFGAPA